MENTAFFDFDTPTQNTIFSNKIAAEVGVSNLCKLMLMELTWLYLNRN